MTRVMKVNLSSLLLVLTSFSLLLLGGLRVSAAIESRNRLEDLFIWKVSEELKLSISEEKSFSDLTKKLNQQRSVIFEEIQNSLKKISEVKEKSLRDKELSNYRSYLKKYHDLTLEEFDQMKKLFGSEKLAKYLVLKNELTLKVKSLLATPPDKNDIKKLQDPKIVE